MYDESKAILLYGSILKFVGLNDLIFIQVNNNTQIPTFEH